MKWLKIIILIILGAIVGIAAFSFVMAKNLWFPSPLQIIDDNKAGVEMKAYTYLPWLWNRERTAKIELFDRKNDGPEFEIKLYGNITNIQLIHSGEDFAVVSYRLHFKDGYQDTMYILHRVPLKDGKESLDRLDIAGMITVVSPDESGYFTYTSEGVLTKYDWEGKGLMSVNLPKYMEFWVDDSAFIDNTSKLNIKLYDRDKDESILFIWDLVENTTLLQVEKSAKLFYYNQELDKDESGNILCSRNGLVPVEREIPITQTPIQDTIKLLLSGELTDEERERGISTEYPLEGLSLKGASLKDGVLTLEFDDHNNKTVGGACRVGILWFQIEATAKQFPEVREVRFLPEELFQP